MTFSIRKAHAQDAAFVMTLFARQHVRAFTHGPGSVEAFLDGLQRSDCRALIVERDGHAFGHASFAIIDGWLMEIHVIAFEEQRTGAGRFAMEWLVAHGFAELGVHRIFLEVLESNVAARALYERLGFGREGCYRDGFRADDGSYHNLIPYGMLATETPPVEPQRSLSAAAESRSMAIAIRPFESSDTDRVVELWCETGIDRPWLNLRAEIAAKVARDAELFLVAQYDSNAIGSVMGAYDGRRGWIYHLAVDPRFQRSGIGRTLMRALEEAMRARGITKVNLQVRHENDSVVAFYKALDYVDQNLRSFGKRLV